jgi:hypothetical protein
MHHHLSLFFLPLLIACGEGANGLGGDNVPDNALEGEFPPECGTAVSSSSLNLFEYEVLDLGAGGEVCNDLQSFELEFDWPQGPVFLATASLESGSIEVRLTPDGGDPIETVLDLDNSTDELIPYTDCDALTQGLEPGTVTIRLMFDEAVGSFELLADDDLAAGNWYLDEMCYQH